MRIPPWKVGVFGLLAWASALGGLLGAGAAAAEPAPRSNLLLIYVDDLGYGDLGSYGHPVLQTPNLDRLAEEGVRLTNYYAPSALCSPSRAALLTGRHPYRTGIQSWIPAGTGIYLRDRELTLAELLRAEGYGTALVGKWHLNSDLGSRVEPQPNDQGFDYFYGHNAFQTPTNRNPDNLYRNREKLPVQAGYTAQLYVEEAMNWLEGGAGDGPFFLMLSMAEPHTPIENPPAFNARYAEHTQGPVVPIPSGLAAPPKALLTPRGPGEYYANITYLDHQLGRLLAYLKERGLRESTLIVFASDNGPVTDDWLNWYEVNAYGATGGYRGRKHYLYEGGLKVPAMVSQPGRIPEGVVREGVMVGTDWLATLATLLAFPLPTDRPLDSRDQSALLLSGAPAEAGPLHWALPTPNGLDYAVREGPWKLLLDQDHAPQALYQLEDDPLELFDLRRAAPDQVSRLQRLHAAQLQAIEADPLRPTP